MVVVTVQLEDNIAARLNDEAQRQNTTLEQLLADNAAQILDRSRSEFQHKLNGILNEDHELLRRLA